MELPSDEADKLLDEIEQKAERPPIALRAQRENSGEPLPLDSERVDESEVKVILNMQLVAQIQHETSQVASIIGHAMNDFPDDNEPDDSCEVEGAVEVDTVATVSNQHDSVNSANRTSSSADADLELGENYKRALSEVLLRAEWSKAEMDEIARKHGLMVNGLIDGLNAWADEQLGDYLIDGDGPYTVQRSLMEDRA
jgi:hypothetical protein